MPKDDLPFHAHNTANGAATCLECGELMPVLKPTDPELIEAMARAIRANVTAIHDSATGYCIRHVDRAAKAAFAALRERGAV